MKWAGGLLAGVLVAGLVMSAQDDSCAETVYSGGRLIECESTAIFQPARGGATGVVEDAAPAGVASIPLPPSVMGLLGAVLHGGCKTSMVPEGQWTVCNDGFSLLERGPAVVATVLRLKPNENPVAKAGRDAAAARAQSAQEVDRELEEARAGNTALQARLKEIAAHEAEVGSAESLARSAQAPAEAVARFETSSLPGVEVKE